MEVLEILRDEVIGFFGIRTFWDILSAGDYEKFLTYEGIKSLIIPIIPLLILLEFTLGIVYKKPQTKVYKINFLIYVFNRFIGRFISIAMVAFLIGVIKPLVPFKAAFFTWYWLIYGYIIWEFAHFIYHYLAHKVRLLWCLHSTHHAPENMNLSVTHAHFFLEAPYADLIRTSICLLAGVEPKLLFLIMFIDGTYGAFIHVGEGMMKKGHFGILSQWILTPLHHRIHHARNAIYMDTNFCNLLNIWDRVFGTYQNSVSHETIEYGITREMDSGNFFDVYFGEFICLFRDVWKAPGLKNKLLYIFMPPGWSHDGNHKTAKITRQNYLQKHQSQRVSPLAEPAAKQSY